MAQQKEWLKLPHVIAPCILIAGILGIIFGLMLNPDRFPTISLYLAALGSIWSVVIPS